MKRVIIAGVGPGSKSCLTEEVKEAIDNSEVLIGSKRLCDCRRRLQQQSCGTVRGRRCADEKPASGSHSSCRWCSGNSVCNRIYQRNGIERRKRV